MFMSGIYLSTNLSTIWVIVGTLIDAQYHVYKIFAVPRLSVCLLSCPHSLTCCGVSSLLSTSFKVVQIA